MSVLRRAPVAAVLLLCTLGLPAAAAAQPQPQAPSEAPAATPATTPPSPSPSAPALPGLPGVARPAAPAIAPADLSDLIVTLENPASRDALVAKLKALQRNAESLPEAGTFAAALDTLNGAIEARVETVGDALVGVVGSVRQLPILARWAWLQASEPISRALWWSVAAQAGAAVLAGFAASLVARLPLRGWRDRLGALPLAAKSKAKAKASLAHLAVNLAALLVFLLVTWAVLAYGDTTPIAGQIAGDALLAIGAVRGLTSLSKALLAPENPRRRLPAAIDDALARGIQRWLTLLLGLAFYGHAALRAAERLGLPWTVQGFLRRLLFLVVAVLLVVQIYRLRGHLARLLGHWASTSRSALRRYLPWPALAAGGHHLLAVWVALVYLVWAVGVEGGAVLLTRGLLVTLAALLALRAFHLWLDRTLLPRPPAPAEEGGAEPEPEPPRPASRVAAVVALRAVASALALAVALEAWGVDVGGWLQTSAGRGALASVGRVGVVVAVAALLARAVQAGAARYVAAVDEAGQPVYSNRTRTLVSIVRNFALLILGAGAIVEVLAELGVNTSTLLAGAGVVGLALGFGSQRLVQDLITGMFILLGDTVRVGDVVDLGGKSGVVEAISMRTVTLRAYNGDVHTIPFSSIDIVTNMTKDFSCYVFDVAVALEEDVDRVVDALRAIDAQLRREWPYRRLMLEPLEIAGVDAFRETAVVVKARTKVRPGEQWKVGREFNRRIKRRFDELGVELARPYQTVYVGAGKDGAAPAPLPIEQARREPPAGGPAAPRRAVGEA